MRIHYIFLTLASYIVIGCQTPAKVDFAKVSAGMEKQDVLEIMGNPARTERFHGKDRWTYIFYDERTRMEKEVHFLEGNAVYVGDVWQPEPEKTAIAVDQKNEQNNAKIDAEIAVETAKNREAYSKYEKKVKGEDGVHYMPEFKPLQ